MTKNVPEIRFNGFFEDWDENYLGGLIDIRSAARVHKEQWTEAGVPFFRTSDVVSIYKGKKNTNAYISQEVYQGLSDKIGKVKKGDILITGGGSIGIPYLVPNEDPLYFKDADLLWLKNDKKFDGNFLYTFFFSAPFKKHIKSISHIGTIAHYTIEQAKATPINTCDDKEQTQIGNTFQKLDSLINRHQQKHDKLSNIKKTMLDRMLPKQGETIPEIRFKGFSGEWEERYLSDVCWFQEGPGVRSYQFTTSGVKLFNGTNIEKGKIDLGKTNRYISEEEAYAEYSHFLADAGDVVIACSGITVAKFEEKVAVLGSEHLPLCMNTSTMRFKVKPLMMHRDYLLQLLASSLFKQQIGGSATGSAQLNFGPSHVSRVLVPLPQVKEQTAIGNYFQKLDTLITQHQQQITKLNNIKQACLTKMFV
jgi:type I restriction enzyme S subunit